MIIFVLGFIWGLINMCLLFSDAVARVAPWFFPFFGIINGTRGTSFTLSPGSYSYVACSTFRTSSADVDVCGPSTPFTLAPGDHKLVLSGDGGFC